MKKQPNGFTLIELMIVVAIMGILASIAIPQFANMVAKSQEGVTKGNLGAIRSALSIYYSDNEGLNSGDPANDLTAGGRYIASIPFIYLPTTPNNVGHQATNLITIPSMPSSPSNPSVIRDMAMTQNNNDGGGFYYDASGTSSNPDATATSGQVTILCNHSDMNGNPWSSY